MKIKTTTKQLSVIPNTHTRIVLIEKGTSCRVKSGKNETLEIAAGKLGKITPRKLRLLVREIVHLAKAYKLSRCVIELRYSDFKKSHTYNEKWFWGTVTENLRLAQYEFSRYKTKKSKAPIPEFLLAIPNNKSAKVGCKKGIIIADATNAGRDLSNTPGGDMTPEKLAAQVKKIFSGTKTKVNILNHSAIKKLKMGGILGVGQGAKATPRFIILEHSGAGKRGKPSQKPLVLVGKGITFDTGGLQIKPQMSMYEMHMDMSGGATVIAAMKAITDLKLKKNVIALIPAAENAVGESAIRPGDVLTMMSGLTVDVLHTDAEGRLVLADALHHAQRYNPKLIVDVATLTGAAAAAVGPHSSAIMTKDRKLEDTLRDLGEESGDYVTPLPLWDEYKQHIKGVQGDVSNIASGAVKQGGAITAGMFLSYFTKKMKWVHIDMAPRMTSVESDKLARGASGEPTRLLIKIAEKI